MAAHRSSARVHSRSAFVVALLLLTLGLAGVMAYQAWDATRSHQKIAQNALSDHTKSAAWLLASAIRTQFFLYHLKPGLDVVAQAGGTSPGGPLKDLDGIKKDRQGAQLALFRDGPVRPRRELGWTSYSGLISRRGSSTSGGTGRLPTMLSSGFGPI